MPLFQGKSKKSLQKNIKAEMEAHPDKPKQDLAIAYSVQRQARKKKMAMGGEVAINFRDERRANIDNAESDQDEDMIEGQPVRHAQEMRAADGMPDADDKDEYGDDMISSIMSRRKMAQGGEVADVQEENGDEASANPNSYDDQNESAGLKELYDDSQISPQPEDSNMHGDDIEEDSHDMVSSIRKKLRLKRGF